MKISAIFLALLPVALALPLMVPVQVSNYVAARDGPLPVKHGKDLKDDLPKREVIEGPFPVKYAKDIVDKTEKREHIEGVFAVGYKKDIIRPSEKRSKTPGPFGVGYRKDVIDSTIPAPHKE